MHRLDQRRGRLAVFQVIRGAIRADGNAGVRLRASATDYLASTAAGAAIAMLNDPFGVGSSYAAVGAVPPQLALAGALIQAGGGAPVVDASYTLKIRVTSADGKREAAETFILTARAAPGPTPTPTSAATAPVLARASSAGGNPLSWVGGYTAMIPDSDYIACRWRVNGGAWTYEAEHLFTSADFLDSEDGVAAFQWPLFKAHAFAGGDLVEVQEGVHRGTDAIVWSTVLSDTMAKVVQPAYLGGQELAYGYGSGNLSLDNPVACQDGDKVLIVWNGNVNSGISPMPYPTLTLKNAANNNVIATTSLGITPAVNGVAADAKRAQAWWVDLPAGVTSLMATINMSGSTQNARIALIALRTAKPGAPDAIIMERRTFQQPGGTGAVHYVNGPDLPTPANNLVPPVNGLVIDAFGCDAPGAITVNGAATKFGETIGAGGEMTFAYQRAAGDVTVPADGAGAINNAPVLIFNTKWSPAP